MLSKKKFVAVLVAALFTGAALGIGVMIAFGIWLSRTGIEFESIPYAYESSVGRSVFHTPKFTLVFEELDVRGAGSGSMTIAGEYGVIPAFWRVNSGFSESWGTNCACLYSPVSGVAVVDFHCNVFTIHHDRPLRNAILNIGTTRVDLDHETPVVIISRSKGTRIADAVEAKAIVGSLHKSTLNFGAARELRGGGPEIDAEPEPEPKKLDDAPVAP